MSSKTFSFPYFHFSNSPLSPLSYSVSLFSSILSFFLYLCCLLSSSLVHFRLFVVSLFILFSVYLLFFLSVCFLFTSLLIYLSFLIFLCCLFSSGHCFFFPLWFVYHFSQVFPCLISRLFLSDSSFLSHLYSVKFPYLCSSHFLIITSYLLVLFSPFSSLLFPLSCLFMYSSFMFTHPYDIQ